MSLTPEQATQLAELEALKAASAPTQESSEGKLAALAGRVGETTLGIVAGAGALTALKVGANFVRGANKSTEETARAFRAGGRKSFF
jgi:hypothetical protein